MVDAFAITWHEGECRLCRCLVTFTYPPNREMPDRLLCGGCQRAISQADGYDAITPETVRHSE